MPTAPADSNLILHLMGDAGVATDAGGSTPATASGDVVARWADQSGNGNHVTQATLAERPTYQLHRINGLPVVRFRDDTGVISWLRTAGSVAHGIGTGDFWMAAVFEARAPMPGINPIFGVGSYNPSFSVSTHAAIWFGPFPVVDNFATTIVRDRFYLIEIGRVGGVVQAWMSSRGEAPTRDANTFAPSSPTPIADAIFYVGSDNIGDYMAGDIAELMFYRSSLSAPARAAVELYLRTKYWTPRLFLPQPMSGLGSGGPFYNDRLDGM